MLTKPFFRSPLRVTTAVGTLASSVAATAGMLMGPSPASGAGGPVDFVSPPPSPAAVVLHQQMKDNLGSVVLGDQGFDWPTARSWFLGARHSSCEEDNFFDPEKDVTDATRSKVSSRNEVDGTFSAYVNSCLRVMEKAANGLGTEDKTSEVDSKAFVQVLKDLSNASYDGNLKAFNDALIRLELAWNKLQTDSSAAHDAATNAAIVEWLAGLGLLASTVVGGFALKEAQWVGQIEQELNGHVSFQDPDRVATFVRTAGQQLPKSRREAVVERIIEGFFGEADVTVPKSKMFGLAHGVGDSLVSGATDSSLRSAVSRSVGRALKRDVSMLDLVGENGIEKLSREKLCEVFDYLHPVLDGFLRGDDKIDVLKRTCGALRERAEQPTAAEVQAFFQDAWPLFNESKLYFTKAQIYDMCLDLLKPIVDRDDAIAPCRLERTQLWNMSKKVEEACVDFGCRLSISRPSDDVLAVEQQARETGMPPPAPDPVQLVKKWEGAKTDTSVAGGEPPAAGEGPPPSPPAPKAPVAISAAATEPVDWKGFVGQQRAPAADPLNRP